MKTRELYKFFIALGGFFLVLPLSGCLVAGVSSGGGWFIWPGSFGLLVVVLLIVFLFRRGR
jgi:hypothetical protein